MPVWVVSFTKRYLVQDDLSPTGSRVKVRAFIYNQMTGIHMAIGSQHGSLFDVVSDIGEVEGNRYDALLKLLAVSTEMRAFLDALAKAPADAELLSIFADWLEEQGEEAGKFRELAQEDGDPS